MDYDGFQSLNDQPCGNYRCNDDIGLDAAFPSSTGDQNAIPTFASNARDTIGRLLNLDSHSVEARLGRIIYHVDGDDDDTDTEG